MSARLQPVSGRPPGRQPSPLADGLRWAAVCLLGLVVAYRPMTSGLSFTLARSATFGLLLLISGILWLSSGLVRGEVRVRMGLPALVFCAFIAAALVSASQAANWFAALKWCWLLATYGLTAFLVLQMADAETERRFLLSCLLATAVALSAYALWHYALYMPALRRWLAAEPVFFRGAVGAAGPMARDLAWRVAADRAYGSFLTPNQLADFLVLTLLPLSACGAALWGQPAQTRRGRCVSVGLCFAGALLMAAALYLSRSKGGWISFGFGILVMGLTAGRAFLRRHPGKLLVAVVVFVLALVLAYRLGALPGPRSFAASLGVRLGYWQTSARIAVARPAFGVGPGNWPEWYAMLKQPEFEETRSPHSLYVQLWAETGAVGVLLWLALCAAVFVQALRRPCVAEDASPIPERMQEPDAGRAGTARRRLTVAGLSMAALALVFDYAMLGTFAAPKYVPAWLGTAPFAPYVLVYAVWAAAFLLLFARPAPGPLAAWGLAAGLAAFLLHSAAELTLDVPAIGGTAAVLAALLAGAGPSRRRRIALRPWAAALIFAAGAAIVAFWSAVVTGRALEAALSAEAAEALQARALEARGPAGLGVRPAEVTAELRRACAAVPWDDGARRALSAWLLDLARRGGDASGLAEATEALRRAVELNPLNASGWALRAEAQGLSGDVRGAAASYRRAAQLSPSLPQAWYRYGLALEASGAKPAEIAEACSRTLELMPRQYHKRNMVLGPAPELAKFWQGVSGARPAQSLLSLAMDIAADAGAAEMPAGATDGDKVARLAKGLEGGADLARKWDSYDAAAREREFWDVAAGRLWQWALQAKVRALGAPGGA